MTRLFTASPEMLRAATFGPELGPGYFYRYSLERTWAATLGRVVWIMMNPSIASHLIDDPTIRRVVGFTTALGRGSALVVNMFAWISKNPRELAEVQDPVGPDNLEHVLTAIRAGDPVVAAWGVLKSPLPSQVETLISIIQEECPEIRCLGMTKDGHPKHPLYLSGETTLVPWTA
jgi:hypothetical protein